MGTFVFFPQMVSAFGSMHVQRIQASYEGLISLEEPVVFFYLTFPGSLMR